MSYVNGKPTFALFEYKRITYTNKNKNITHFQVSNTIKHVYNSNCFLFYFTR